MKYLRFPLGFIFHVAVVYLACTFVAWSWNPATWHWTLRLGGLLCLFLAALFLLSKVLPKQESE
jgi:membrane protein implicated in regulation of membrane protease activity